MILAIFRVAASCFVDMLVNDAPQRTWKAINVAVIPQALSHALPKQSNGIFNRTDRAGIAQCFVRTRT